MISDEKVRSDCVEVAIPIKKHRLQRHQMHHKLFFPLMECYIKNLSEGNVNKFYLKVISTKDFAKSIISLYKDSGCKRKSFEWI